MSSVDIASSFVEGAPPGELNEVVSGIKSLTSDTDPALISKIKPAFQRYNESQLVCAKLPGAAQPVLISKYNRLPRSDSSYYDTTTSTSFDFDHVTQKASNSQTYTHDSQNSDLIGSLSKSLAAHFAEHFPPSSSSAFTVIQSPDKSNELVILLSSTKSSPSNFLSGRWRSIFTYSTSGSTLSGTIHVQVHYYEDGNVALNASKSFPATSVAGSSGAEIVRKIATIEKQYQEEVNRALVNMNEGAFKSLRRQLPVTRQKIEWDKYRGYGLGENLRGESGGKR